MDDTIKMLELICLRMEKSLYRDPPAPIDILNQKVISDLKQKFGNEYINEIKKEIEKIDKKIEALEKELNYD